MKHDDCICTVEISSDEADAGADVTLKVQVKPPRKGGLRGPRVSIRDHEGAELAQAELTKADSGAYASNDIVLSAPRIVGEHVYRAVVIAADKDGAMHEQASTDVRVVVKPHAAELTGWDVPSAIVAGARFKFMVGVKCSAGCCLGGRGLSIFDQKGSQVGAANLGRDVWPGTDALYVAEIEGEAPPAAGAYQWEVKTADWDLELPHAAGSLAVPLRVVSPPDCEITVEAFDREKQTPIKDARVVVHPYRAMTDENGVARVEVTKGQYDILVSASKYVPVSTTVEVTADMITRAELDLDPPWEPPDEDAV
ncbi:MAG: hypothetical protein GEU95_02445 [Rhizobiales bacterium]|nr:hypothetical protein [Hyphomicrobiales bacterium]